MEQPGATFARDSLDEIAEEKKDDVSFDPTKSIVPAPVEARSRPTRKMTSTKLIYVVWPRPVQISDAPEWSPFKLNESTKTSNLKGRKGNPKRKAPRRLQTEIYPIKS